MRLWSPFTVRRIRRRLPRDRAQAAHYRTYRAHARSVIEARLRHWSQVYPFPYNRVAIRNQVSRWGSCSTKRNLNFNYRLAFLPLHLIDYVIVHELCHLAEFNHGPAFWKLVAQSIPEYESCARELRAQSLELYHPTHEPITLASL